jgi:hypothetical protein
MTGNWKATLGVLLVFVLGALAGGLVASVYFVHRTTVLIQRGPSAFVELMEGRMTRNLDLDAGQKQKIHSILMQALEDRKRLQATIQPDVQRLNFQTVQEIQSVMRPEQASLFHQNLIEYRKRFGALAPPPRNSLPGPPLRSSAPANAPGSAGP